MRDLPISAVVGRYVELKPKGKNEWGCCPFHDEKSPSFEVHTKTNTFHCFGCGEKGDGIGFISKKLGMDFVAAVEEVANQHGVPVAFEDANLSPAQLEQEEARRAEYKEVTAALEWASGWFAANGLPADFMKRRGLTPATIQQAGLGYAPTGGKVLLEAANKAGFLAPVLVRASLVREVKKAESTTYFDFFQDRAMTPIRNNRGICVAFTGRYIGPEPKADEYQPPKAVNSEESTWIKGQHFYGLDVAAAAIRQQECAFVVEGNMDVLQMRQHGLTNTVGQNGTALTDEQIALLKRYCTSVVLTYDNDPAGRKAIAANAPRLLAAGFHVSVLVPAPDGETGKQDSDPDSFLLGLGKQVKKKLGHVADNDGEQLAEGAILPYLVDEWVRCKKDYITHYATPTAMSDADLGVRERANAITRLGELIETLPTVAERIAYHEEVGSLWPAFRKTYKLQKRKAEASIEVKKETKEALSRLTAEQMTASMEAGFFEKDGAYWYYDTQKGRDICICEFTIDFLFFVVSNSRPKYVVKLINSFHRSKIGTFSTEDFVSKDAFNKAISRHHGYVFEGSQHHLNRIKIKRWAGCREAVEANYLGWNEKAQVYAWNNGLLYKGTFYPCDQYGVVTLRKPVTTVLDVLELPAESQLEVDGTVPVLNRPAEIVDQLGEATVAELVEGQKVVELSYHYLPAGGSIQLGGEDGDDLAKKFKHFNRGSLTFHDWAKLMCTVHGQDNGRTMIAFYIATLFRSIIHKANGGYFPILYLFGDQGSGKTTACLSLMYMFGTPPHDDGIGLESGSTTTGMQRFLSSISDGLVWLNEYKNSLPVRTLGMLKDLAGGSGKMTGMNTSGNETKTTPPRSAAMVSGQDLPTADAALLARCIVNEFDKREHQYGPYKELADVQASGATTAVTCALLGYRDVILAGYKKMEVTCTKELRHAGHEAIGDEPNSRSVLNVTSILTPCRLLMDAGVSFPFSYDELKETLVGKMLKVANIAAISDEVETFFLTLSGLAPLLCGEDLHYKIEKDREGRILLYMRTRAVHGAYQQALKGQGGTAMGISALQSYMEKHRSYVGAAKSTRFLSPEMPNPTSAFIFDYRMLREQGIEFRTHVNLRSAPLANDDSGPDANAQPAAPEKTTTGRVVGAAPKRDVAGEVAQFVGNLAVHEGNPREQYRPKALFDAFINQAGARTLTDFEFNKGLRLGEVMPTAAGLRTVTWVMDGEVPYYVVSLADDPF